MSNVSKAAKKAQVARKPAAPSPKPTTVKGAEYGCNCLITIPRYGKYAIRVLDVGYDIAIQASEESSANAKAYYPLNVLSSDFGMTAIFPSYSSRAKFTTWMRTYMDLLSSDKAVSGFVVVSVPAREFVRKAVFQGTIEYGQAITDVAYRLALNFVGASNPIDPNKASQVVGVKNSQGYAYVGSTFEKLPANEIDYFYPTGIQLKGAESLEGTMFDIPPADESQDWFTTIINSGGDRGMPPWTGQS